MIYLLLIIKSGGANNKISSRLAKAAGMKNQSNLLKHFRRNEQENDITAMLTSNNMASNFVSNQLAGTNKVLLTC